MNPSNNNPVDTHSWLQRVVLLRVGEGRALLWAAAYFFFLLLSFYFLRPVREAMGIAKGVDKLPWLMTATMLAMLVANPVYAMLVSKLARRRFIPIVSHFFAANLLLFVLLFKFLPEHGGAILGYVFYVWLSVFNLFVVSIFWSLMTDVFNEDQGKRLFGMISMGGTLGAIVGAATTEALSRGSWGVKFEPVGLMVLACVGLELAVLCMTRLAANFSLENIKQTVREPGPDFRQGFRSIMQSSYLQMICLFILLFAVTSTFLYLMQADIVARSFTDNAMRTAAFARMDLWGNVLTLSLQLFVTSRLLRGLGVSGVLLILPLVTITGFGALLIWPGFAALAIVQVLRRGLHYAVDRPAREILYINLGPDERYKSKAFIDTFIYRGGDMLGVWIPSLLTWLAIPLGLVALSTATVWLWVSAALGRSLKRRSSE
ncbi:NTP/NDP exchange transporter [Undibacterium flavidum]|uniref:ADP,ATP carrier protein n=1 Tax=Undibacterium flavidum TaxID=2762297 RepID=A0ABR6Y9W0_9BURK|nr:Npt1/Npt2 family nucleotide transporter [Undibacterium flavidum]MBC3873395.1 MFS transporter [Undibacterium flavidum]